MVDILAVGSLPWIDSNPTGPRTKVVETCRTAGRRGCWKQWELVEHMPRVLLGRKELDEERTANYHINRNDRLNYTGVDTLPQ
jgi:hypothetical protein